MNKTQSGIDLISAERNRQMQIEGWTYEHDDLHQLGEMIQAAAAYEVQTLTGCFDAQPPPMWPWEKECWKPAKNPVRNLTKAGALIAAEIDRLNRMSVASNRSV